MIFGKTRDMNACVALLAPVLTLAGCVGPIQFLSQRPITVESLAPAQHDLSTRRQKMLPNVATPDFMRYVFLRRSVCLGARRRCILSDAPSRFLGASSRSPTRGEGKQFIAPLAKN
jgi:hypothetical protein